MGTYLFNHYIVTSENLGSTLKRSAHLRFAYKPKLTATNVHNTERAGWKDMFSPYEQPPCGKGMSL